MKNKQLNAKGKGEYSYDYDNDIAVFKVKDRNYLKSIDFDNFIIDIDDEGFITGVRVIDASKVFKINKIGLKNMSNWEFNSSIEDKVISLQLRFSCILRNKQINQGENFVREALDSSIHNSEVKCTA